MKKNLTIADIAKLAGVAKSTVSRYFNDGYVKEETRIKIRQVIDEYHYKPNTFARLKAKESKIIGVIAPCLDSALTSRVLMAIDETLHQNGYTSLIINTNHDSSLELKNMISLGRMNVDGIILNATKVSEEYEKIADELDIPVVFIGQKFQNGISIVNDDYGAGKFLAQYVIDKGYKDILFLKVKEFDKAVGVVRAQGIINTFQAHGIRVEVRETDFGIEEAKKVLREALNDHMPQLVLCSTTRQMMAVYKIAKELNWKIPYDISVCGFGNYEYGDILQPSMTTIQFDFKMAGIKGAEAMLNCLRGIDTANCEIIGYDFFEGESVMQK